MPYSTGGVTKNTFRYGPEVHKLHLEFQVKSGDTVHRGQPVILNADGTISPAGVAADESTVIGVSIHEADSAYSPDKGSSALKLVVVAMRGYTVVDAVADGSVPAGPVAIAAYVPAASASNVDDMSVPGTKVNVNTLETQGSNAFATALAGPTVIGWSMTPTAADTEAILVIVKD